MELFRRKKKEKEDPELNPEGIEETVDAEEVAEEAQEEPEAPEESEENEAQEADQEEQSEPEEAAEEEEGQTVEYAETVATVLGKLPEASDRSPEFGERLTGIVERLLSEIAEGRLGEETVMMLAMGLDSERAVAAASAAGEIRGRNTAIEEHLLTRDDSDGVPHPGSGAGCSARPTSIFDLARGARL
ncbi:MAG: hypothetical protein PUA94_08685 [Bacteroidales bacterium]|nr:hypothetical protein [Bacteroidales bacterium]